MKRVLKSIITVALLIMACSCNENSRKKALLPNISGKAGEVIVVIDKADWEGQIGSVIRDTLAADCPYLPQREPLYSLVDIIPSGFSNMFQIHRNILIVNISKSVTEPGIVIKKDVWATPQCVIYLNAIDNESASQLFKDNSQRIIATLEQAERDRVIANARKYEERSLAPVVEDMIGGSVNFPSGYKLKMKTSDFLWITYTPQYTQQSVLIFRYPVQEGQDMMSKTSLVENINAMLQKNVPGMFDNTYMTIAPGISPAVKYMNYKGHEFAEIRGLWDVHNDYMGGPFVAHAFYSQDGQEIIVMLSFVYAPKYDKRHYLRQVESLLYSFKWKKPENEETKM
ncbi:MAG: DUF4837 family protein [Bacteroidales bacterium]|nr:DUF4837 family protein [Bacteroidales bacterium]